MAEPTYPVDETIAVDDPDHVAHHIALAGAANGHQTRLEAAEALLAARTAAATPETLVYRDAFGRIKVVSPVDDADVATKAYVDSLGGTAYSAMPDIREFGGVGDGVTDDSAAFFAAVAAKPGETIFLPDLEFVIASATRLLVEDSFGSFAGPPNGHARIKFTHANGGLDFGNGTDNVWENKLHNVLISGASTATSLVRARKAYEMYFSGARLEQAAAAAGSSLLHLNNCGQIEMIRCLMATAPIGFKIDGSVSPIGLNMAGSFFDLTELIRLAGPTLAKFDIAGAWIETCPDILTIDAAGESVSIGEFVLRQSRVLNAAGQQRIVRAVAATSVSDQIVAFDDRVYVDAPASTAPLVDFTAVDNSAATFRVSMNKTNVLIGGSGPLIDVHGDQLWYLFRAYMHDITDAIGRFDPARYAANPYQTGGVWLAPQTLEGAGSPEGVVAATPGSTYQRIDGPVVLYQKTSGLGNTGWDAVATASSVAAVAADLDALAGDAPVNVVAATGATETLSAANIMNDVTMDEDCTFTFTSPSAGGMFAVVLRGTFTPTFPASVIWPDGTPPAYAGPALYVFATFDAGSTWMAVQAGKAFA